MKKKQHQQSTSRLVKVAVIVVGIVLLGIGLVSNKKQSPVTIPEAKPLGNSPYSTETLQTFWESRIKPIAQQWIAAQFPYPEVNVRSSQLASNIEQRTQKGIHTHASFNYHWTGKTVSATAGFNTNTHQVTMTLHIPTLLDVFERMRESGVADWQKMFETYVIIILMHEMEHGAHEGILSRSAVDIDEESRAWAETCRHTIVPLVDKYDLWVYGPHKEFYKAWVVSSGHASHPAWQQNIQKIYGSVNKLPQR